MLLQGVVSEYLGNGLFALQGMANLTPQDIASVGTLILLEGLLSADNALVLALIARRLPDEKQRNSALNVGIMLSFVFRAIGLLFAKIIINFWFMRAAGAAYLLYLAGNHFREKHLEGKRHKLEAETAKVATVTGDEDITEEVSAETEKKPSIASPQEFRKIAVALALTDLAFAVDSILAAVALTSKLWVIYIGVILGIIALRLVASAFIKLLERYPLFADTAYILVAWAGIKLGVEALESFAESIHRPFPVAMPEPVFWVGMALIVSIGTFIALRKPAIPAESAAK